MATIGMNQRYFLHLCQIALSIYLAGLHWQVKGQSISDIFNGISPNAHEKSFSIKDNLDFSSLQGGHLQGIQNTKKGEYIISGSSNEMAYLLLVNQNGHIYELVDITENSAPEKETHIIFNHASGFQLVDNHIVLGLEKKGDQKSGSVVNAYDLNGNRTHRLVTRNGTNDGGGTAGAVGIVRLQNNTYLMAVGSWHSHKIDFYVSKSHITNPDFKLIGSWREQSANKEGWHDNSWAKYQSLNLIKDIKGNVFLFAFGQKSGKDIVDLYSVDIGAIEMDVNSCLTKIAQKPMHCKKKVSFRYGAGIGVNFNNEISILATDKNTGNMTIGINLFKHR